MTPLIWIKTTFARLKEMIEKIDCDNNMTKLTSSRCYAYLLGYIHFEQVKNKPLNAELG